MRHQKKKKDSRTAWKNPLVYVKSTIADGPPKTRTVTHCVSQPTVLSLPLKKNLIGFPKKDKSSSRRKCNAMPSNHELTFSSSHCDCAYLFHTGLISHEGHCSQHALPPYWSFTKTADSDIYIAWQQGMSTYAWWRCILLLTGFRPYRNLISLIE